MSEVETRYVPFADSEVRMIEGEKPVLVGYAAVYGSLSEDLGGWREEIRSGTFEKALARGPDVLGCIDHDEARFLGRTSNGTVRLSTDSKGLRYEIDIPNTSYGRDLIELVKRGDIKGSSFRFKKLEDKWEYRKTDSGQIRVRVLSDLKLRDVCPVLEPAYPDTDVAMRSLKQWEETQIDQNQLNANRLRLAEAEIG